MENKMIMDEVLETKVSDADIANVVTNGTIANQKFTRPRKTRTIINKFSEKIMPNDPCPCGSGKKFKKCCQGTGKYDGRRELTAQEMSQYRYGEKSINEFKENISK